VSFARELTKNVEPQTCGNYFSSLSNIFTVARPAWGYPLSRQEFDDALVVIRKLGLIRKGNERNRRPTLLLIHVSPDQARIDRKPFAPDQTGRNALRHYALKYPA
jgi:hypothetical protein